MENKKGIQLSQAFGAILTLVLVAVLVIVAIVIFVELASSFEAGQTVSVANESIAAFTGTTNQTLAGGITCGFGIATNVIVYNETGDTLIAAGNYTAYSDGNIINDTADQSDNAWQISYDYTWGSEACTASENMTSEFGNYTSLIGLVGTIIFLGLVIGVLVASFAFGGRKEV